MVRVKRGNVSKTIRKKILKFAKGFRGAHSLLFRVANGKVMKGFLYSYVGRRRRKQDFKKLWICRVNASVRKNRSKDIMNKDIRDLLTKKEFKRLTYSVLKKHLKDFSVTLNLKMLAQISILGTEFDLLIERTYYQLAFFCGIGSYDINRIE